MSERFFGSMQLLAPEALNALGTMYRHNTEVLEQYVENGYDAGAQQVIVSLERNRIVIFDDGHGFVPTMSPEDHDTLQVYKADIASERLSPDVPLEVLLPELSQSPSLHSFQWMMECIGLSNKRYSHETRARGIKGLGALSFQQIANRAVWYSRPEAALARSYWHDIAMEQNPPTYSLRSATADELRWRMIRYEIDPADPLKDPLGDEAQSGTRVELTELREGIERSLRPPQVIRSLQERFGNDIRAERLKILVVDRVTEEGLRSDDGLVTEVPPASYPGTLIFHRETALRGGRGPFGVEVYYDPLGRALYPKLVRMGSEVCPITQLADFNKSPWNNGKLSGLVSYPDLSDEEAPWDAQKSLPLAGPVYNQWQKRVWEMAENVEGEIAKIEDSLRLSLLEEFSSQLGRETIAAMQEIPEFADIVVKAKRLTIPRQPARQEKRLFVTVLNENDDSVAGARIVLENASNSELIKSAITKRSGRISLGQNPYGRYKLRIDEVPEGATVDGMAEYILNLSVNMPGARETFRLITGEPKRPRPRPFNNITPFFHEWPSDEPYIQRLEYGVVEINTEGSELRFAINRGDFVARATLCAQYMASAIAEFAAAEDEDREDTLINASRLFGVLLRRITVESGNRRRYR